ncbi:zf-ZPR1-domain-containing protein [Gautieria morchelliformis]|nr:zf-ZPR1-domain-containing protein [Gautieria morchelliformis]
MSAPTSHAEFFPSIGSVANQTDLLPEEQGDIKDGAEEEEDNDDRPMQEVGSLCMSCGEQGITRMLLTSIPFFHEVIVMSFRCERCGNQNNEIQSAGAIRDKGVLYTARILDRKDLNRQLVKSQTCTVLIPEYELTIPAHRGQLTTVEGLVRDTMKDLAAGQVLRRIEDEAAYNKIQHMLDAFQEIVGSDESDDEGISETLRGVEQAMTPFTVQLDDPAGDSFIEFYESMSDPKWNLRQYTRSKEQNITLGLAQADEDATNAGKQPPKESMALVDEIEAEEIFVFPGVCSSCGRPLDTLMKKIVIPYFKDVLIMSTNCEHCGYKDNEVKSGSAISDKGQKIILKVEDRDDLSRDILKSETCGLHIPEIDLLLHPGTLGGRFTTVEGILEQVFEELSEKVFTDSIEKGDTAFIDFLTKLKKVKAAEMAFTLVLDDPLANSYLQSLYAPDPDPNMQFETYERTWQQNEELGLNDMITEGYEEGHAKEVELRNDKEEAPRIEDAKTDQSDGDHLRIKHEQLLVPRFVELGPPGFQGMKEPIEAFLYL